MSDALPPLDPPEEPLPSLPVADVVLPQVEDSPLPSVKPSDAEVKVKLTKLELPSGYALDPEQWGIDLDYTPGEVSSSFATDLDDEPASVVELPAELRQFMNTEEGQKLSPEEVKSMLAEVLKEHLPVPVAPPTPEPESKRVLVKRALPIAWILFFLFNWQLALIFLVPTMFLWWFLTALKWEKDARSRLEKDIKRWKKSGKVRRP